MSKDKIDMVYKKAIAGAMICSGWRKDSNSPEIREFFSQIEETVKLNTHSGDAQKKLIKNVSSAEDAYEAGVTFKKSDIDILFVIITANTPSEFIIQGVLAAGRPVVLAGVQISISGSTNSDSSNPLYQVFECQNAMVRCGIQLVDVIYDAMPDLARLKKSIGEWCVAANAVRSLKGQIIGYLGHAPRDMLNINVDPTTLTGRFGVHIRVLEMCELAGYISRDSQEEIVQETTFINERTGDQTSYNGAEFISRIANGLDMLIKENGLSALAYHYAGRKNGGYAAISSRIDIAGGRLIHNRFPLAYDGDIKSCIAMYIINAMDYHSVFSRFTGVDFTNDAVTLRLVPDDYEKICDQRADSFDEAGDATRITIACLNMDDAAEFRFVTAEGTLKNATRTHSGAHDLHIAFKLNPESFIRQWSASGGSGNVVFTTGSCGYLIDKYAKIAGIDITRIC